MMTVEGLVACISFLLGTLFLLMVCWIVSDWIQAPKHSTAETYNRFGAKAAEAREDDEKAWKRRLGEKARKEGEATAERHERLYPNCR